MFGDELSGYGHLGGVHLAVDELASFDRPRFIKTAAQAFAKWQAGTEAAGGANGTWATNLSSSNKPIVDAAVAQIQTMKTNFARAIDDGKYEAGLRKVGDQGIKAAARAKADNYTTGTQSGSPGAAKMDQFLTKLIAYETQNLPQIYAMPKGTLAQGKARMNAWADIMAAGAGSFT